MKVLVCLVLQSKSPIPLSDDSSDSASHGSGKISEWVSYRLD